MTNPKDETLQRIEKAFSLIEYKKGWKAKVTSKKLITLEYIHLVYWEFDADDVETGKNETWNTRKYYISPHMTFDEIVQTMFLAARVGEMHEILESFKYRDRILFNPHQNIDALIDAEIPKRLRDQ